MEKNNEEKKKKRKLKVWQKWAIGGLVTLAIVGGAYVLIKRKYDSLPDEIDLGNLIANGEAIELEPGRKVFIPEKDYISFVNADEPRGISIAAGAFKKGIKTEDLRSATGNFGFMLREGRTLQYKVEMVLSMFMAVFGPHKAKKIVGVIPLIGKYR